MRAAHLFLTGLTGFTGGGRGKAESGKRKAESGNAEKLKGDSVTEGFAPSKPWFFDRMDRIYRMREEPQTAQSFTDWVGPRRRRGRGFWLNGPLARKSGNPRQHHGSPTGTQFREPRFPTSGRKVSHWRSQQFSSGRDVPIQPSTKHQAPSTKHQAPSTKHQAPSTPSQATARVQGCFTVGDAS
jgi:hypothetical protein